MELNTQSFVGGVGWGGVEGGIINAEIRLHIKELQEQKKSFVFKSLSASLSIDYKVVWTQYSVNDSDMQKHNYSVCKTSLLVSVLIEI